MKATKLYKLADKTLRALVSGKYHEPIRYEINTLDDTVTLSDDFFKAIEISQSDVPYVVTILKESGHIELIKFLGGRREYDHDLLIVKEHYTTQIKLKNEGVVYINTTSFTAEYYKNLIMKWVPLVISVSAFLLSILSIYLGIKEDKRPERQQVTTKQIEDLNDRFDSLLLSFPKTSIQVGTLSDTSSRKKD